MIALRPTSTKSKLWRRKTNDLKRTHGEYKFHKVFGKKGTDKVIEARFKRRTLCVPNLMQMRKIYCFRSSALDSAHVKFDV